MEVVLRRVVLRRQVALRAHGIAVRAQLAAVRLVAAGAGAVADRAVEHGHRGVQHLVVAAETTVLLRLEEQAGLVGGMRRMTGGAAFRRGEGGMHDTVMLLGMLGWDRYDKEVEILTDYFPSSGTGQLNAIFPLP